MVSDDDDPRAPYKVYEGGGRYREAGRTRASSFYHLVGAQQKRFRDGKPERLLRLTTSSNLVGWSRKRRREVASYLMDELDRGRDVRRLDIDLQQRPVIDPGFVLHLDRIVA